LWRDNGKRRVFVMRSIGVRRTQREFGPKPPIGFFRDGWNSAFTGNIDFADGSQPSDSSNWELGNRLLFWPAQSVQLVVSFATHPLGERAARSGNRRIIP
jgi:hypothetical protein